MTDNSKKKKVEGKCAECKKPAKKDFGYKGVVYCGEEKCKESLHKSLGNWLGLFD
tara:strand:- start:274 stop:438 length:165 start_codon:yes stop_codon:yes gene_type:complete